MGDLDTAPAYNLFLSSRYKFAEGCEHTVAIIAGQSLYNLATLNRSKVNLGHLFAPSFVGGEIKLLGLIQ